MAKILYITPFFNYPPTDGASLRSITIFEKLSEKYDVDLLTYNYKTLSKYMYKTENKDKIHILSSEFQKAESYSFIRRLYSKTLPGFSSHNPITISNDIDALVTENGEYDFYFFATQLVGQAILHKKFHGIHVIDLYDVYTTYTSAKYSILSFWQPFYWLYLIEAYRVKSFEKKNHKKV